MKLFYLTRRERDCVLVGADRLSWGRRGPSASQGTREAGDPGPGPLIVSGGTQLAHLTPPPFSHSFRQTPGTKAGPGFFLSSHWPARPAKGWLPNQGKRGGVGLVFFFFPYFFFQRSLRLNSKDYCLKIFKLY